jgi:hypothetical protein
MAPYTTGNLNFPDSAFTVKENQNTIRENQIEFS